MPQILKFDFPRFPADPTPAFPRRHSMLLPVIPIRLINKDDHDRFANFGALIDSGAGCSIYPVEIARLIDLTLENDRTEKMRGISGQEFTGYLHDFILEVGGWKFNSFGIFTDANIIGPVLGREDFFNLFEVRMNLPKESIELKPLVDHLKS